MNNYLYGIILALAGALWYVKGRSKRAESLLQNQESQEKINKLDGQITNDEVLLDVERNRRKDNENVLKEEKQKPINDVTQLAADLNDLLSKK